jgi:23S rRNA (cytidine1920-2'-O)/16S rRNA (cytidine1409-2'-O)-methyltransferase
MMTRLDLMLVRKGFVESREKAKQVIKSGKVVVDGMVVRKPGKMIGDDSDIVVLERMRYVSRGGMKLEAALRDFGIDVRGMVAVDVGASKGGFTDCLLQSGASRVYAIDVGHGQLSPKLASDPRVISMEGVDIRDLGFLPEPVDIAVVDVSFISLRFVLPSVVPLLKEGSGIIIALIKPQFEGGRGVVDGRGVIRDEGLREKIIEDLTRWIEGSGMKVLGLVRSPIPGKEGNVEYFALIRPEAWGR